MVNFSNVFDVNLSIGRWPFRPYKYDTMAKLVPYLASFGITGGLVRSNETVFTTDIYTDNETLKRACAEYARFQALPVVNPVYPAWRDEEASAVLLLPSYQNYSLLDGRTIDMARALASKGKRFVISMREMDERAQHPLCQVKAPTAEILGFAEALSGTPVILLNCYMGEIPKLSAPNLYYDLAFYEPFNVTDALRALPKGRMLFGSHAPFFTVSAELSKLEDGLSQEEIQAIVMDNAKAIGGIVPSL